jgi:hypothetical protein
MTEDRKDAKKGETAITEAGAVELEEGALEQASGGLNFTQDQALKASPQILVGKKVDLAGPHVLPTGSKI